MAKNNKRNSFLPWRKASEPEPSKLVPGSVHAQDLQQGNLYLVKLQFIKLALFEGWHDDMVVFSLLREESTPLRWSDTRLLVDQFQVFAAFDVDGNPAIFTWEKLLKASLPARWFEMFEEARRFQRDWAPYSDHAPTRVPVSLDNEASTIDRNQLQNIIQKEPGINRRQSMPSFRGNVKRTATNASRPPIPDRASFLPGEQNEENTMTTEQ